MNERGSVLIACAILSLLLVAMVVWYWQWSWHSSVEQVNRFSGKTAMQYADSGMQAAAIQLRSPDLKQFLDVGTTNVITQPMPNGRFEVALYRQGLDPNLVDTYTTGYFYLSNGSIVDPQTNQRAQWAVINAKFRIANVAQFLAALPGNLQISYGTNAANGTVYAKDLTFASGPCGVPGETQVGAALYFNSVSPSPAPCFVNFTANPANAQRQSYPPNFARLDATLRAFYQSHATTQPLPAPFSGAVAAPSDFPVYFVNGPLDIAQSQPLTVQGVYVIYATGDVYIHNPIVPADANSWVGVLSERSIHLAADAPANLSISGNFVCDAAFVADGAPRSPGNFSLHGGVVSMTDIQLSSVYQGNRVYTYQAVNSPNLILPNFTEQLQYTILHGKYSS